MALAGCGLVARFESLPEVSPMRAAPESPARPWVPPAADVEATAMRGEVPSVPAEIAQPPRPLSLPELVDTGLRLSPDTRETWAAARVRAAAYGASRSPYYPSLTAGGGFGYEHQQAHQGALPYEETPYGPFAQLSWLLLDFGGRSAGAEAARQALVEANWQHNQAIQDLILRIARAYYLHVAAVAQLEAARVSLAEAETSYAAADERMKTGVGILADTLAAKAAAAQARLAVEDFKGQVATTRGNLATALGLPANAPLEIAPPREKLNFAEAELGVDRLIEIARTQRPDLMARRATLRSREQQVEVARSNALPRLQALGVIDHIYFAHRKENGSGQTIPGGSADGNTNYTGALVISYPLFEGFRLTNQIREAEAEVEKARAALESSDEQVVSQVWNSYYAFQTALELVKSSNDLLTSATESFDVSLGSYRAGIVDIVELLQAQTLLARARAEDIRSDATLYVSLAQLVHDTGSLLAPEEPATGTRTGAGSGPGAVPASPPATSAAAAVPAAGRGGMAPAGVATGPGDSAPGPASTTP